MKSVVIKGKKRDAVGKKNTKLLRAQENVPCVLYGGDEPIHFYAPFSEFRKVVYTPSVFLIDLEIDGEVYKAIMQDEQWHAVEEQLLHVDFLQIQDDKPVKVDVPVVPVGMAKGIKQGGKLKTTIRRLTVKAYAKDLPDTIEINVEELGIGQNVKVSDLNLENIEILNNKSNVIIGVDITRAAKSAASDDIEGEGGDEVEEAAEASE